jgi:hypothetical protein
MGRPAACAGICLPRHAASGSLTGCGMDAASLAINRNGLEEKLTGANEARIVKEILA